MLKSPCRVPASMCSTLRAAYFGRPRQEKDRMHVVLLNTDGHVGNLGKHHPSKFKMLSRATLAKLEARQEAANCDEDSVVGDLGLRIFYVRPPFEICII